MSIIINIGMWFERFVIIVTSLAPRLPPVGLGLTSSPRDLDIAVLVGKLRAFLHDVFCLFVALSSDGGNREVKTVLPQADSASRVRLERESKDRRAAWPPHRAPEPAPGGAS